MNSNEHKSARKQILHQNSSTTNTTEEEAIDRGSREENEEEDAAMAEGGEAAAARSGEAGRSRNIGQQQVKKQERNSSSPTGKRSHGSSDAKETKKQRAAETTGWGRAGRERAAIGGELGSLKKKKLQTSNFQPTRFQERVPGNAYNRKRKEVSRVTMATETAAVTASTNRPAPSARYS
ncbi:uncharacterized protein [Nicotiana sylvestris]|uniref:uncharacterized protein n=1 Tax=Nicotiana sylvestris TaxID=4096 RepID=UPI00388C6113